MKCKWTKSEGLYGNSPIKNKYKVNYPKIISVSKFSLLFMLGLQHCMWLKHYIVINKEFDCIRKNLQEKNKEYYLVSFKENSYPLLVQEIEKLKLQGNVNLSDLWRGKPI